MPFLSARRGNLTACLSWSMICFSLAWMTAVDSAVAADPPAAAPATASSTVTVDDKAREDVKKMPLEMARILEAKQYKLCVETFFDPEVVKKQAAVPGGIDAMTKDFSEVAPTFVKLLKGTKGLEPTFEGADKASFEIKSLADPKDGTPVVQLKKVGKYWYFGE